MKNDMSLTSINRHPKEPLTSDAIAIPVASGINLLSALSPTAASAKLASSRSVRNINVEG